MEENPYRGGTQLASFSEWWPSHSVSIGIGWKTWQLEDACKVGGKIVKQANGFHVNYQGNVEHAYNLYILPIIQSVTDSFRATSIAKSFGGKYVAYLVEYGRLTIKNCWGKTGKS